MVEKVKIWKFSILRLRNWEEFGIIDYWNRRYLKHYSKCTGGFKLDSTRRSLSITDFIGIFLLFGCGLYNYLKNINNIFKALNDNHDWADLYININLFIGLFLSLFVFFVEIVSRKLLNTRFQEWLSTQVIS